MLSPVTRVARRRGRRAGCTCDPREKRGMSPFSFIAWPDGEWLNLLELHGQKIFCEYDIFLPEILDSRNWEVAGEKETILRRSSND